MMVDFPSIKKTTLQDLYWYALLAYIFLIPFKDTAGDFISLPQNILLGVIILDLLNRAINGRWSTSPLDRPILAYVVAIIISLIFSIRPSYSFNSISRILLPVCVLYFATFQHLTVGGKSLENLAWTIIDATFIILALSLINLNIVDGRLEGLFSVATRFGKFLDLVIPLTVALLMNVNKPGYRIFLMVLLSGEIVSLLWSGTRGAWLAQSFLIFIWSVIKKKILPLTLLIIILITGTTLLPQESVLRERLSGLLSSPQKIFFEDPAMNDRRSYYKTAIAFIKERPLTGWGYGNHIAKYVSRSKNDAWYQEHKVNPLLWHAHNLILEILLEGGVLALAAALWIGITIARHGYLAVIQKDFKKDCVCFGFLGGIVALGIHCFISVPQWSNTMLAFVFISAFMAACRQKHALIQ